MGEKFKSYEEAKAALQHQLDQWDSIEFTEDTINQAFALARDCLSLIRDETAAAQRASLFKDMSSDIARFDRELDAALDEDAKKAVLAKAKIGFKRAFETLIR